MHVCNDWITLMSICNYREIYNIKQLHVRSGNNTDAYVRSRLKRFQNVISLDDTYEKYALTYDTVDEYTNVQNEKPAYE